MPAQVIQSICWKNYEVHEPVHMVTYLVYAISQDGLGRSNYFLAYFMGRKQWSEPHDESSWWETSMNKEIVDLGFKVKFFAEVPNLHATLMG